jgi:hypothetical protein
MRRKSHRLSRQAHSLLRETQPCSTIQLRPAASSGLSGQQWVDCLPGFPGAAHDEPGCFDQVFLQFIKETSAGRTPNVQRVGISYMHGGKWVPNESHAMGSGTEFHVGPHIMIIGLDPKMMPTLNQDGSNGETYVNHLPGHPELFLVIPIRGWDDAQAVHTAGAETR